MENSGLKFIAQWENEDSKFRFIAKNLKWCPGVADTEIGPIAARFQCGELQKSDCLRFVDVEFGAIFNCRQAETIEKEISTLLSLDLTEEERKDCLKLRKLLNLIEGNRRDFMYFRIFPQPSESV